MNLWQLFWLFFRTAAFTCGGGYAMIPLLSNALVPIVLPGTEMANIIALAQVTPGAVGLNAATYIGFREFALLGSLVCTFGLVAPGVIIATAAAKFRQAVQNSALYKACLDGIRPMVVGLIASVVLFFADGSLFTAPIQTLWQDGKGDFALDWRWCLVFAVILILQLRTKLNVIWLLAIAASLGTLLHLIL